jgi:uncharacterized RDD family membrane protein YckC
LGDAVQRADFTTRAVAGFIDLLLVIGLARLPDVLGFLSATGYILARDGMFDGRSVGKRLIGLRVLFPEDAGSAATYRESIIRNVPLALSYSVFLIPYAGWALGPSVLVLEGLAALGDERGRRIGDLLARTMVADSVPERAAASNEQTAQTPEAPSEASTRVEEQPIRR